MKFPAKLLLPLLALVLACAPRPARAHAPTASSADFRWEHGRLEARAVFSLAMATALLGDPAASIADAASFAAHREALNARFAEAFAIDVAGKPLHPQRASAELTADGDAAVILIYPPLPKSVVVVHARFLERVSPESHCTLRVWDGADILLAHKLLLRSSPRATAPAEPPPPKNTAPAPAPSPTP